MYNTNIYTSWGLFAARAGVGFAMEFFFFGIRTWSLQGNWLVTLYKLMCSGSEIILFFFFFINHYYCLSL